MIPEDHLSSSLSFFLVYGCGTIGIAVTWLLMWHRRNQQLKIAKIAHKDAKKTNQLTPGPTVLSGHVEYARSSSKAVRVDIEQEGTEKESSGIWSYTWTEKNRHVHAEPFYLRLDSGERIRVEPDPNVVLIDALSGLIRIDRTKRVKFAQLSPNERVYAIGELAKALDPETNVQAGYRSAPETLVLRPKPGESMLLSSKPLEHRNRKIAQNLDSEARWLLGIAIVLHLFFYGFHLRCSLGETHLLPISQLEQYTTASKGKDVQRYLVHVQNQSGQKLSDYVSGLDFAQLKVGDFVAFRVVPGVFSSSSAIGSEATASHYALLFAVILAVGAYTFWKSDQKAEDWYDHKVIDSGSGRLEDSLAKEQGSSARS